MNHLKTNLLKIHCLCVAMLFPVSLCSGAGDHLHFEGQAGGPGNGKHLVLLAGDEEYRSEEAMPMLGQILARHGFEVTVLFSLDEDGTVNPDRQDSLSHSEALETADGIVMALRFRRWDDEAMKRFEAAFERGVPIVALRTSTHAFKFPGDSPWQKYSFRAPAATGWENGFGRQVLGETWVNHHGKHKREGTRSVVEDANRHHSILRGVGTMFGKTDVYGADPLEPATILLRGEVTASLEPDSPGVPGKNDPMQPIAWSREYGHGNGTVNRVFTTTMGSSQDLLDEDLRRLIVNAVFWGFELEVPQLADVSIPADYEPTPYGFKGYRKGLKPIDFVPKSGRPQPVPAREVSGESRTSATRLEIGEGDRIALVGAGLGSRMNHFGHFETEVFLRFPDHGITIRNLCDEGDTPGFRPHPGRGHEDQYAFPGAKALVDEAYQSNSNPNGHFETPDEWLGRLGADTIVAFFGYNSSFDGSPGVARFKRELEAFVRHTLSQQYNGEGAPQLALVSPTAFQDLSKRYGTPNGAETNINLSLYTNVMRQVADEQGVLFVDVFGPSLSWYEDGQEYTTDGALLNDRGYRTLAPVLADRLFGEDSPSDARRGEVHAAVMEKNRSWLSDYKIPNGVHVYGRRFKPYGPQNYPDELKKIREMTALRDKAIWAALAGEPFDLAATDAQTHPLPPVPTNYQPSRKNGTIEYRPGAVVESRIETAEGYEIALFAGEDRFPDLANPVQLSFDNQGRLWVATMASYPHWRPGDPLPEDKLLIFEDTDGDGKADRQITFADDLHIPIGFEIAHDGVYVSQSGSLVFLQDTDGDDRYDRKEVLLSGFDDHDTHHAIAAFCADPSGAIVMAEGLFLHSNIETAYGPVRGTNGGFFRYAPQRKKLIRYAQFSIPNPWGIAYDDYGQDFFLHTSGPSLSWMLPGSVRPRYGANLKAPDLLTSNRVRPTSGLEFVSSRHFPDDVQGDVLLLNNIGFLGAKQHRMVEDGAGFTTEFRQDLFVSKDPNFRPVDLEFAPDGSLYVVDWHNALIGHMQHNARDPNRDHEHGRVYRVKYPSRPLVEPAKVADASVGELLENLKLPEARTRYRTRRELRGRDPEQVMPLLRQWVSQLGPSEERLKLEALWVSWGFDRVDAGLLERLLKSEDHRIRAAAVRVLRFNGHRIPEQRYRLIAAAGDAHGRVRLEAVAAASWLSPKDGLEILDVAAANGMDGYSRQSHAAARAVLEGEPVVEEGGPEVEVPSRLTGVHADRYRLGSEIYAREGHCGTCHQPDGKGLPDVGFPPLAGTEWANGDPDRLIKLTLKGLIGPITVKGRDYPGLVPMTAFEALLNDEETAAVLTYIRNSFGNAADPITPQDVGRVRKSIEGKIGMYRPEELLEAHPLP